jgi:hypothetical protein
MLPCQWCGEDLVNRYHSTRRCVPKFSRSVSQVDYFLLPQMLPNKIAFNQRNRHSPRNGCECTADISQICVRYHTSGNWSTLQCQRILNASLGSTALTNFEFWSYSKRSTMQGSLLEFYEVEYQGSYRVHCISSFQRPNKVQTSSIHLTFVESLLTLATSESSFNTLWCIGSWDTEHDTLL